MIPRSFLRFLGHQQYLRFGVRDRVIRWFHDPDTAAAEEFEIPFFGAVYRGQFNSFVDWSAYYYGAYSLEELRLIEEILAPIENPVFVDVGANVGNHTLFAATLGARVFSFEPYETVSRKLERKIADNRLANVRLEKVALGERNEEALFTPPPVHNTGTGSFVTGDRNGTTLRLPIRVGDEMLAACGAERVDFIKIDTEGFEKSVLRGLRETLKRHRPVVFFEWIQTQLHGDSRAARELFPDGYTFYEFVGDTVVLGVFRKPAYHLQPLDRTWPDGNIVAVPDEYVRRVRESQPGSAVLKRLRPRGN